MRAALRGDATPILRLRARAAGLTGTAHLQTSSDDGSDALFAATRCEETAFPWQRTATSAGSVAQALAAARVLPSAPFAPFGPSFALSGERHAALLVLAECGAGAGVGRSTARGADARARRRRGPAHARRAGASGRRVDSGRRRGRRRADGPLRHHERPGRLRRGRRRPRSPPGCASTCTPTASPFTPTAVPPRSARGDARATEGAAHAVGDARDGQRRASPAARRRDRGAALGHAGIAHRRAARRRRHRRGQLHHLPGGCPTSLACACPGRTRRRTPASRKFAVTGPAAAAGTLSVSPPATSRGRSGAGGSTPRPAARRARIAAAAHGGIAPALRSAPRAL